ncbi:hypothetical protein Q2357_19640, partial [Proteus mirabilis]|uniref:hypothetical protein n=1 Tax=Proteus mirabilis TaxID=584 RepID=UPI00266511AB
SDTYIYLINVRIPINYLTRGFEESNLKAVWYTVKVCLYNKTLILQIDRVLKENFWRSGGRKPSAVAMYLSNRDL